MSARYAIYFVPAQASALARFGAHAIGYDIWSRATVPLFDIEAYREQGHSLTAEPRRYGFHATFKAPFHLKAGTTVDELEARLAAFARTRPAVALGRMQVQGLSRFIALMPVAPPPALAALAAACVTEFDSYRAPLNDSDRARRRAAGLTQRQAGYLDAWGYPHVFEEFRFHMTLTGPVADGQRQELCGELAKRWAEIDESVTIGGLTLAIQPGRDQAFHVAAHVPLQGC